MTALYFRFPERGGEEALAHFMAECANLSLAPEVLHEAGWFVTARVIVCAHNGTLLRTFFSDWELYDPLRFRRRIVDMRLAAQAEGRSR